MINWNQGLILSSIEFSHDLSINFFEETITEIKAVNVSSHNFVYAQLHFKF